MERTRNDPYNPKRPSEPLRVSGKLLDLLDALQPPNYEVLPTGYLHKLLGSYAKPLIACANAHGLIRIPLAKEARQLGARNRSTCWELTDQGKLTLAAHHRYNGLPWGDDQFAHKYLRSIIQFSFDQAVLEVPNLRKRSTADILAHGNCPQTIKDEVAEGHNPSWIPLRDTYIKPDAPLFGFEYTKPDGKKRTFYLHGFEADRGTQPLTGFDRQTIQRKIRHYCEYVRGQRPLYVTRYGLTNVCIAFIAVDASRAASILKVIELEAQELAHKFIVKVTVPFGASELATLPTGERMFVPVPVPPPDGHMLTEDWMQAGGKTLNIVEILKGGDHGRDAKGGSDSRVA